MEVHERRLLTDQLADSRERLLVLVQGLTNEQWHFRPADECWSICECLEHVIVVEDRILGMVDRKLEAPPETSALSERPDDSAVAKAVPDRSARRQAPDPAKPTGRWPDAGESLAEFEKMRTRSSEFAATTDADLRNYFSRHASFGELDCYQWLLVMSLHGERHARQIEEIKAHPGFPTNGFPR